MSKNVYLAKCGHTIARLKQTYDSIIVLARILTVGTYMDMNGTEVIVDEEVIKKLVDNYNEKLNQEYDKFQLLIKENANDFDESLVKEKLEISIDDFECLPNQIDHNTSSVRCTVGNVIGKMELRKSQGKLAIFAHIKVKGPENVSCVGDNRWRNLSVQYNPKTYDWIEVSWVVYGADSDANKIMSQGSPGISNTVNNFLYTEHQNIVQLAVDTINTLERTIFIEKKLITLCKMRKLTKADAYFINKELKDVKEITVLSSLFNVLDSQLKAEKKEKFLPSDESFVKDLHNLLKAVSNDKIY